MDDDVLKRADELDKKFEDGGVDEAIERLAKAGRRSRTYVRLLALSLLLDVFLSVVAIRTAFRAEHAAVSAASNKRAIQQTCAATNSSDADQRQLWEFVLRLSSDSPTQRQLTPAEERARQEQTAKFRAFIDQLFAEKDCAALGDKS